MLRRGATQRWTRATRIPMFRRRGSATTTRASCRASATAVRAPASRPRKRGGDAAGRAIRIRVKGDAAAFIQTVRRRGATSIVRGVGTYEAGQTDDTNPFVRFFTVESPYLFVDGEAWCGTPNPALDRLFIDGHEALLKFREQHYTVFSLFHSRAGRAAAGSRRRRAGRQPRRRRDAPPADCLRTRCARYETESTETVQTLTGTGPSTRRTRAPTRKTRASIRGPRLPGA